ncbi:TPA: hypothetical protein DCZ39_00840 [Patescibacteria group bacterium]|nr:hypothetical protein [Candidatus Gracilibacteria bacterium]
MMRKESYLCLQIPKINKTVFINNGYGEATFVYDGVLDIGAFTALSKKLLAPVFQKIAFDHKHIDTWKQALTHALFVTQDQSPQVI